MEKFDPQKHHRRSIRLPNYDYTQIGAYYITIVTHNRELLFGEVVDGEMKLNALGQIAQREWERLQKRFKHIELGAFVIMPDHVHGIIIIRYGWGTADSFRHDNLQDPRRAPTGETVTVEQFGKPVSGSIPTIVRSYKSSVALRINYARPGDTTPIWQRNYYEHVIRNEKDMQAKWDYVESNPANWENDNENPHNL
jgi:REP element-mobilizing transposase RayT